MYLLYKKDSLYTIWKSDEKRLKRMIIIVYRNKGYYLSLIIVILYLFKWYLILYNEIANNFGNN
jgi:hypothetical protein